AFTQVFTRAGVRPRPPRPLTAIRCRGGPAADRPWEGVRPMVRTKRGASMGAVLVCALLVAFAPDAFAAISFSPVPSGTAGKVAGWTWDNGDPAIGGGSNGNISTILVSDTLDSLCFSGAYPGPGSP